MTNFDYINTVYSRLKRIGVVKTKKDFAELLETQYNNLTHAMKHPDSKYLKGGLPGKVRSIAEKYSVESSEAFDKHDVTPSAFRIRRRSNVQLIPHENYDVVAFRDLETTGGLLWDNGNGIDTLPEEKTRVVPREFSDGNYLVVRVHGHSMDDGTKRSICEGDELIIKRYLGSFEQMPIRQKLFVLNTMDGSVVKQVFKIDKEKGVLLIRSFNPNYDDYEISMSDLLQVFTVEKKLYSDIMF